MNRGTNPVLRSGGNAWLCAGRQGRNSEGRWGSTGEGQLQVHGRAVQQTKGEAGVQQRGWESPGSGIAFSCLTLHHCNFWSLNAASQTSSVLICRQEKDFLFNQGMLQKTQRRLLLLVHVFYFLTKKAVLLLSHTRSEHVYSISHVKWL